MLNHDKYCKEANIANKTTTLLSPVIYEITGELARAISNIMSYNYTTDTQTIKINSNFRTSGETMHTCLWAID